MDEKKTNETFIWFGAIHFFIILTIDRANNVNVNSGPNDIISLKIDDNARNSKDIFVGIVMTTAAEMSKNAQSNPERCVPVSEKKIKLYHFY